MMQDQPRGGIQAIARAGAVLRALEPTADGLPLGELAAIVGLPKSTVHRLVGALAEEGLVVSAPGGTVRLGPALARLASAARRSLPAELRPLLEALRDELDETVDLAVLDGDTVRFVDQAAADQHRLRAVSAVGEAFPLHCTANGKALLAALPPARVADLVPARLARSTAATIGTRAALAAELDAVRTDGVAFDREEHTEGISAVGAAVLDAAGAPVAAISVPVPTARFAGREAVYARAVRAAAQEATRRLGGVGG